MSLSESSVLFSSPISTVAMRKHTWLLTWLIVDPPGSHVLFCVLVAPYLLLDGVPGNTEDGNDGACHLGDVLTFLRILLRVTLYRIGLAGVVWALLSFSMDMMYTLDWSSVRALGEAPASTALIAAESVFSTCFSKAAAMDLFLFGRLLSRPFVRPLLLGFLSCHSHSSSF